MAKKGAVHMAYITGEQLTQYDSKIKQYITSQIQNTVNGYSLNIAKLNKQIEELNNIINKQQDIIDSLQNNIKEIPETNTETVTPILRSVTSTNSVDDNVDINNTTIPILRSVKPTNPIIVQEDIQEDYVVYDRVIIPNEGKQYKNIVVTSDNKSNRVWFSMWKTFDDRELENKEINIVWLNALGKKGESHCDKSDIGVVGDRLYFAWNIPIEATVKEGPITYAIRIVDGFINDQGEYVENYAWHTLPSTIECVKGLITDGWDDIEEAKKTPGWVDYIEGKYKNSILKLTRIEYNDLTEKDPDTLYLVQDNSTTINICCGDIPISGGGGGSSNIVALTKEEYDTLVDEGTIDPETLYIIKKS